MDIFLDISGTNFFTGGATGGVEYSTGVGPHPGRNGEFSGIFMLYWWGCEW